MAPRAFRSCSGGSANEGSALGGAAARGWQPPTCGALSAVGGETASPPKPTAPAAPAARLRGLPGRQPLRRGVVLSEVWGSALERHFQARGDGRAASRGGSGRRSPWAARNKVRQPLQRGTWSLCCLRFILDAGLSCTGGAAKIAASGQHQGRPHTRFPAPAGAARVGAGSEEPVGQALTCHRAVCRCTGVCANSGCG